MPLMIYASVAAGPLKMSTGIAGERAENQPVKPAQKPPAEAAFHFTKQPNGDGQNRPDVEVRKPPQPKTVQQPLKQHEYGERITHVWPERKGEFTRLYFPLFLPALWKLFRAFPARRSSGR